MLKINVISVLLVVLVSLVFGTTALAAEAVSDRVLQEGGVERFIRAFGEVSAIDWVDSTITLTVSHRETLLFYMDENTRLRGGVGIIEDLEVGYKVVIIAKEKSSGFFARVIFVPVRQFLERRAGEIVSLNNDSREFNLLTKVGEEFTFQVEERTRYGGAAVGFEELQAGLKVGVLAIQRKSKRVAILVFVPQRANQKYFQGSS